MKYIKRLALVVLVLCASSLGFQRKQSFSDFSSQKPPLTMGNLGLWLIFDSIDSPIAQLNSKVYFIKQLAPDWIKKGGDAALLQSMGEKIGMHAFGRPVYRG